MLLVLYSVSAQALIFSFLYIPRHTSLTGLIEVLHQRVWLISLKQGPIPPLPQATIVTGLVITCGLLCGFCKLLLLLPRS